MPLRFRRFQGVGMNWKGRFLPHYYCTVKLKCFGRGVLPDPKMEETLGAGKHAKGRKGKKKKQRGKEKRGKERKKEKQKGNKKRKCINQVGGGQELGAEKDRKKKTCKKEKHPCPGKLYLIYKSGGDG